MKSSRRSKLIPCLLLFCFVLNTAVPVHAQEENSRETFDRLARETRLFDAQGPAAKNEGALLKISKTAGHGLTEAMSTSFLILVITGVVIFEQEMKQAHLEGRKPNPTETADMIKKVSAHILDSGDIWLAMTGSHTMGVIMSYPMQIINSLIANSVSRGILRELLQSGIRSYITFIGWEAGAQLWQDARSLLKTEEDYELSEGMWTLTKNKESRRVFAQLLTNMAAILLTNPKLRASWMYNTWRLRVATGDFVTMVAAMSAAGLAGAKIGLGLGGPKGLAVGAGFGIVGGMATHYTPPAIKDAMTMMIKTGRYEWNDVSLGSNLSNLKRQTQSGLNGDTARAQSERDVKRVRRLMPLADFVNSITELGSAGAAMYFGTPKDIRDTHYDQTAEKLKFTLLKALTERSHIRENMINVHMESYYALKLRVQESEHEMGIARETLAAQGNNPKLNGFWKTLAGDIENAGRISVAPINPLVQKPLRQIMQENEQMVKVYQAGLRFIEERLRAFYSREKTDFEEFLSGHSFQNKERDSVLISAALANVEVLEKFTGLMIDGFNPASRRERLSNKMLEKFNFRGFDEQELVNKWRQAAQCNECKN